MKKFRILFDKDKETAWLNELSQNGKAMTGFFAGLYTFEDTEPGKWIYQIDFSDCFGNVTEDYRSFMDEMGIEIVKIWGFWVILRKPAAAGPFEMFTDTDSQLTHYKKVYKLFRTVTILELFCFLLESVCAFGINDLPTTIAMAVIGLISVVLLRQTIQTKHIISMLMEQKGEAGSPARCRNDKVSPLLLFGIILNACALSIDPDTATEFMHSARIIIQIIAIIAMLTGIYRTRWVFTQKQD